MYICISVAILAQVHQNPCCPKRTSSRNRGSSTGSSMIASCPWTAKFLNEGDTVPGTTGECPPIPNSKEGIRELGFHVYSHGWPLQDTHQCEIVIAQWIWIHTNYAALNVRLTHGMTGGSRYGAYLRLAIKGGTVRKTSSFEKKYHDEVADYLDDLGISIYDAITKTFSKIRFNRVATIQTPQQAHTAVAGAQSSASSGAHTAVAGAQSSASSGAVVSSSADLEEAIEDQSLTCDAWSEYFTHLAEHHNEDNPAKEDLHTKSPKTRRRKHNRKTQNKDGDSSGGTGGRVTGGRVTGGRW